MGVVGIRSLKAVGRMKDNQYKGHREKWRWSKSAKGENRGWAKLKLWELRDLSWCVIYTSCMCIFKYAWWCRAFFFLSSVALVCSRSWNIVDVVPIHSFWPCSVEAFSINGCQQILKSWIYLLRSKTFFFWCAWILGTKSENQFYVC